MTQENVKVYGLFVFDDDKFTGMNVYRSEGDIYEYNKLVDELKNKGYDVDEWEECGGMSCICCEVYRYIRWCEFELPAELFDVDDDYRLKQGVTLYAYADAECDKYEHIGHVGLTHIKQECVDNIKDWFAEKHNYFKDCDEEQGLVPPVEEVERIVAIPFDYEIHSDYGRFGSCFFAVGAREITEVY